MSAIPPSNFSYTRNISIEVDASNNLQSMDFSHLHPFTLPANLSTQDLNARVKNIEACEDNFHTFIHSGLYLNARLSTEENQKIVTCATRELGVCVKDKIIATEELAKRTKK